MTFRNRIIEFGVKPADQFLAHPKNARLHPQFQRDVMQAALDTVGFVAPVIEAKSGYLLDGHERIYQALANNSDVPYVRVDVDEDEESYILATFDPITSLANYDTQLLDNLLHEVNSDSEAIQRMLSELAADNGLYETVEERYSRKIDIPIYEPSNTKPATQELYDDTRTQALVSEIQAAPTLSESEKQFLILAAQRHTVFHFARIADWYAHGSPDLQRLMENSALVIVDCNRAIELGYVQLTQAIAEMITDEQDE